MKLSIKRISSLLWCALAVGLPACAAETSSGAETISSAETSPGAEASEQVGSAEQAATAYLLAGKYHYRTDHFTEACSAGTLRVRTGSASAWDPDPNVWTNIPRGDVTYVAPVQASNGTFQWICGDAAVNGVDYSECDDAPAKWVRFYWSPNSSSIDVQCFKICGDGSSASDCLPY